MNSTKITTIFIFIFIVYLPGLIGQGIGIGTTAPQGDFHISKDNQLSGPTFIGTGLNDLSVNFDPQTVLVSDVEFKIVVANAGPNPNHVDIYVNNILKDDNIDIASNMHLGSGVSIVFDFLTGHTYNDTWIVSVAAGTKDQFIVTEDKVGIGTGSPIFDLDLVGDFNLSGDIYKNGGLYEPVESIDNLTDGINDDSNLALGTLAGPVNVGVQNVYIGNEAGRLNTSGNNNLFIGFGSGEFNSMGSGNVFIGNEVYSTGSESNRLKINNNDSSQPLIYGEFDNNKFVGINRTTKISSQEVFGISRNVSGSGAYGGMYMETCNVTNNNNNNSRPFYGFAINNIGKAWIEYDGGSNDIVVENSNGNFKVAHNNATKPIAGSWAANSDARLKKNIRPLDGEEVLEKLKKMKGVYYEWDDEITGFKRPIGEQIGFIAQDLQKIWPEKVTRDHQGFLVTAYGDYDPVFVEAIKELIKKVERQEKTINVLIQKMNDLESVKDPSITSENHHQSN